MDKKPVIILGAGGLAKSALEIFKSNGVEVYCFLDENEKLHGTEINEISIMGSPYDDGFLKLIGHKCGAFVASEDAKARRDLTEMLLERRKEMPVNAIHSLAHVSTDAWMGYGNYLGAGVFVNSGAKISNHCVLHSGAIIEFDAELGERVQIGAGVAVGAGAKIEAGAFIGSGAVIVAGAVVGKNAQVGAGSVVVANVAPGERVFGNPAKKV